MEYAAMLSDPDLVSGLCDLLADPDLAVVKRTIRVFANVYRHALQLLATGDLDETTFLGAWPAVKSVAEKLIHMLANTENEGVIIHIVRFLEASLVAHLLCDVNRYPKIAAQSPRMVTKGVGALKSLVTTPYIGGSAFIVAVKALITVACYKPDLWEPVTTIIEKQIASPPPTLFDHNVRSLHKILQRNLFRLLRRSNTAVLRSKLIEMMVTVGVPRRMLSQWAPPQETRKRSSQLTQSEDAITGRNTPPVKRLKYENNSGDEGKRTPPRDPREVRDPRESRLRDPREVGSESGESRVSAEPRDPRTAQPADPRLSPPYEMHTSRSPEPSSKPETPPASGRSTPEVKKVVNDSRKSKEINSNFEFLKSLISSTKNMPAPFLERCSEKEKALYERLDHPHVVELVLSCLDSVPDSPPEDLLAKLGHGSGDVDGIREHLTRLLAPHIHADFINSLPPVEEEEEEEEESCPAPSNPPSRPSSASSASTAFSNAAVPMQREPSPPSPPSSNRSTPTDPTLVCNSDVDLRQLLNRGFQSMGDVDMRTIDPQRGPRDPRTSIVDHKDSVMDPRTSRLDRRPDFGNDLVDPRKSVISTSTRLDPRIAMADPRPISDMTDLRINSMNPRITQSYADARDPRMGNCPDPRDQMLGNNQPNFMGMGPGMPGGNNMMQNNNFGLQAFGNRLGNGGGGGMNQMGNGGGMNQMGNGGGMNQQNPRMMNGPHGMGMGNGPMDGRLGNAMDGRLGNAMDGRLGNAMDGRLGNAMDGRLGNAMDGRLGNGMDGRLGNGMDGRLGNSMGGRNNMFGPGQGGMGGPWESDVQQNRMGMMMSRLNCPAIFPQATPMRL
ncbi:uncharacterized protein [Panulirus ornatus]